MSDILDLSLSLEQEFSQKGYAEGLKDGKQAGLSEGKHYGIQTAFQRYMAVGILQARCDLWQNSIANPKDDGSGEKPIKSEKIEKHLAQLKSCVQDVPMTNSDSDVEVVTKGMAKAKAKAKVIASLCKDHNAIRLYDDKMNLKSLEENIEG